MRKRIRTHEQWAARSQMERSPGVWVQIPTRAQDLKTFIRKQRCGQVPAFPPELFEGELVDGVPMARRRVEE